MLASLQSSRNYYEGVLKQESENLLGSDFFPEHLSRYLSIFETHTANWKMIKIASV